MSYEWMIAKRYLWSRRRHPFVGVVSTISMIGIAVGVAALIIVLAVMNGFNADIKSRIIGLRSHLVIEKDGAFSDASAVMETLKKQSQVTGAAPYIEGQALLQTDGWGTGVLVRGIDPELENNVSQFSSYLKEGSLTSRADGIVIGSELARIAGLKIGSQVRLATESMEKPAKRVVEGIFSAGMYEYDANLVFVNLVAARNLFSLNDNVSGLSVYLKNADHAETVKKNLNQILGYPYSVRSWADMNRTLFSALKLEKIMMFLVLALIVFVACLNIAGSLTVLVMDKTKDIGVLKALGATPAGLLKIFSMDGLALGLLGSAAGLVAGLGVCFALSHYRIIELPREIYYIDRLPVLINFRDTSLVLIVAVGLSFISALYPAWMAARLDPVKALRYE